MLIEELKALQQSFSAISERVQCVEKNNTMPPLGTIRGLGGQSRPSGGGGG